MHQPGPLPENRRATDAEVAVALRRRLVLVGVLALVAAVVGGAVVGSRLLLRAEAGPPHPDSWDPRVQPYVDVVERERGLRFKHPVYVDFLSVAAFTEQVTSDEDDLSEDDRAEIEHTTGQLRALGLLSGDVDLFASRNQLAGAGIIGYYSTDDERIRVRGTEITPAVQSTLVHELTHALQDQHFDIGTRAELLADDDAASSAYHALVEGDARRIETAWRDGLDKKSRRALDRSEKQQGDQAGDDSAGVPEVLSTLMAAPYALGEAMLRLAVDEGGEGAVNALFRVPPTTEEHQLDPWTLIADRQVAQPVREPRLLPGDERFDDGPLGSIGWLVVLGERLPAQQALLAADGWGGDALVAFERDGTTCVRVNYAGDTPADVREMQTALTAWVRLGPSGTAKVGRSGPLVRFESCDPGTDATPDPATTGGATDALRLALRRTSEASAALESGADPEVARCVAERLVRAFTLDELMSPDAVPPARVRRVLAPCLAPS